MASSGGASSRKYYVLGVIGISAAASVVAHVQFSSDQEIATVREAKADMVLS